MEVSVNLKDGPFEKQSIGHVYKDRNLPESLAKLSRMSLKRIIATPQAGHSRG
jgi:hypothetical protein